MVHLYFGYIVQCLNEEFNDSRLLKQKITGKHVRVFGFFGFFCLFVCFFFAKI